jgi:hypothetical protein
MVLWSCPNPGGIPGLEMFQSQIPRLENGSGIGIRSCGSLETKWAPFSPAGSKTNKTTMRYLEQFATRIREIWMFGKISKI